jgi:hypothetical protein
LGKTGQSSEHVTEDEGFAVGVTEEKQETKLSEGGKGDGRDVDADRLRGGENSTKVIVHNVYGGEIRMSGDNGVEKGIDGAWEGWRCWFRLRILHLSCSPYCLSHSPLSQSMSSADSAVS